MDPTRALTSEGEAQIPIIGDFLKTQTNKIAAIMHSDMKRGRDTAEPLAKMLDVPTIQSPWVGPNAPVAKAWKVIKAAAKKLGDDAELAVVSHGLLINALAAHLLQSNEGDKFHFSHGSICKFDTEDPDNYGYEGRGDNMVYLHWMVTCKLVNRVVEDDRKAVVESAIAIADAALSDMGVKIDEAGDYYMEDVTLKRSLPDAEACEMCEDCADQGWIEESEMFESGFDEPPHHPNCRCEVEYKDTTQRVPA